MEEIRRALHFTYSLRATKTNKQKKEIWNIRDLLWDWKRRGIGTMTKVSVNFHLLCLAFYTQRISPSLCRNVVLPTRIKTSVADPDPHVFWPPAPGSTSQRYGSGSGSFYHHTKIVRKTLIPTILWLFLTFCLFGVKIFKFFADDPGSGMQTVRIRDGKKSDPG